MSFEFQTQHQVHFRNAKHALQNLEDGSVHLIVTSPPYPMVKMWDECFSKQSTSYRLALDEDDGRGMWHAAHYVLQTVWDACVRALCPGGYLCINIGDGLRRIGDRFEFYSNAGPIDQYLEAVWDLTPHPPIVWRKPSNSPTKFLGAGMLPAGSYVTMEHEHILIFRKGPKRLFKTKAEQERRRFSALFWEERNEYFSDLWKVPGRLQAAQREGGRRTAAFPVAIPERLISMFSLYGDIVVDPFAGTGTTMRAAMGLGRNSVSVECDAGVFNQPDLGDAHGVGHERLERHRRWLIDHQGLPKETWGWNDRLKCLVKSSQETDLYVIDSYETRTLDLETPGVQAWEVSHADVKV